MLTNIYTFVHDDNTPTTEEPKKFTQEEVNAIVAKQSKELKESKRALADELSKVRDAAHTTEQQRQELALRIETLEKDFMSTAELEKRKFDQERQALAAEAKARADEATAYKTKYRTSLVKAAIVSAAAAHQAHNPSILVTQLSNGVELNEETGDIQITATIAGKAVKGSVDEVIKQLKTSEEYGFMFKGTDVGGTGKRRSSDPKDLTSMKTDEYIKSRRAGNLALT